MKWFKRALIATGVLFLLLLIGLRIFMYKSQHGFASYETKKPEIAIPQDQPAILVFSKTTAFRHGEAIAASEKMLQALAFKNNWFIYRTEEGGIFNSDQLGQFDLVIWNNSTGPVLNEQQRMAFEEYIQQGGGYLGIHGAGDYSHNWKWYTDELISANFSHHPIKNHIQKTTVYLKDGLDTNWTIPPVWTHSDEWYIFHNSPQTNGAQILYFIDGTSIDPNGDFLWMKGKKFGMGKKHPVVWTKEVGEGRSFYTSMGHTGRSFSDVNFISILEKGIVWAGKIE